MKSLDDKFCMTMIVGEDDRLSYTLPALNFQSVFHQVLEDGIDGVFIEDIAEYLIISYIPMVLLRIQVESLTGLLILPYGFHLLLLSLGQIAILDSFFQDERTALEAVIVDEVSVRYGILKLVGIVWLSLLQILEDCYMRKSVIVTSQLPVAKWYDYINEPTIADAIMDRLTAGDTHRIELKGDSLRRKKQK